MSEKSEDGDDRYGTLGDILDDVVVDEGEEPPAREGGFWYPTVDDIVEIHDEIISEDPGSEPGIEDRQRIEFVVDHIQHGTFGEGPETIHEKAFDLMRLLASNHWFVDGNKRTALNTTNLFYLANGYDLEYGEDLRSMLKLLAVREDIIDRETATEYLSDQTTTIDFGHLTGLLLVIESGDSPGIESDFGE